MLFIDFPGGKVLVKCGNKSIIIDAEAEKNNRPNWFYVCGKPVNVKFEIEKNYNLDYVNKSKTIKKRLLTIDDGDYVLVVNVCPDNKIFFLWFYRRTYDTFRGRPIAEWSYHKGKWYEKVTKKHKLLRTLA